MVERHRTLLRLSRTPLAYTPGDLLLRRVAPLEGALRNWPFEYGEAGDADEGVAAADVVVEEGEGSAGHLALDPEGHLAELDGERILVYAVDAVGNDLALRLPLRLGRGFVLAGAHASELLRQPPGRGEEEVPRPAGGVEHVQPEDGALALLVVAQPGQPLAQHGFEGALDQLGHQLAWGVVGAGALPLGAGGELENGRTPVATDHRAMFEQAFVHRPQLFHVEGGVVDPAERAGFVVVEVDEVPERLEEVTVCDALPLEFDLAEEFAIQHGEAEETGHGLALHLRLGVAQDVEEDSKAAPEIVVVRPALSAVHQPAQAGDAVVLAVQLVSHEEPALLGHEEEEEAVHEAEEVVVQPLGRRLLLCLPAPQEAGTEEREAPLHAVAQAVPCPVPLFDCLLVVPLEPAFVRVGYAAGEPRPVEETPQEEEVAEALLATEDGIEVEGDVGLSVDGGAFAKEPELAAVGDDAPKVVGAVEELLHQGVGGDPRPGVRVGAA